MHHGPAGAPAGLAPASFAPAAPAAAIAGREDALALLERLAEHFLRTEPQGFLGPTLAEAARRARMPLPALLAEVMPDDTARGALLSALGIRPGVDGSGGQGPVGEHGGDQGGGGS